MGTEEMSNLIRTLIDLVYLMSRARNSSCAARGTSPNLLYVFLFPPSSAELIE